MVHVAGFQSFSFSSCSLAGHNLSTSDAGIQMNSTLHVSCHAVGHMQLREVGGLLHINSVLLLLLRQCGRPISTLVELEFHMQSCRGAE